VDNKERAEGTQQGDGRAASIAAIVMGGNIVIIRIIQPTAGTFGQTTRNI
jgi:hypothetical protein